MRSNQVAGRGRSRKGSMIFSMAAEKPKRDSIGGAMCRRAAAKATRVLTWPLLTVFGFIAQPRVHLYLKPTVTRRAALEYGYDFQYRSKPSWETFKSLLDFARTIQREMHDLRPRDMIDVQSFIWVQGSDEYPT